MQLVGKQIKFPVSTRWNSFYDSVKELLKFGGLDVMNQLLGTTKSKNNALPAFTVREVEYLTEYVKIMHPLAASIDFLQGDVNSYYGQVLPTLFSLRAYYTRMESQQHGLSIVGPIIPKLIEVMQSEKRFAAEFQFRESVHEAVISSVSHPKFKLGWLTGDEEKTLQARELLENEVNRLMLEEWESSQSVEVVENPTQPQANHNSIAELGFNDFVIMQAGNVETGHNRSRATHETSAYLKDNRTDLHMLDSYPTIKKIFKRTNTVMCSTGPIERTFNYAGILNNPKRGSIAPHTFSRSVVLKGNESFKKAEADRDRAAKK